MILSLIILEKKYVELGGGAGNCRLSSGFFSKSSRTTLPQFFMIWKVAINKQPDAKENENL